MDAPNVSTYCIDTYSALADLRYYVETGGFEYISFDLETDSVQEKLANIYGIGMSFNTNEAFYIPIRKKDGSIWWSPETLRFIYSQVESWCKQYKLIGWNLLYDVLVYEYNSGYRMSEYIHSDAQLLKHTLDEERPFGLKECSVKYLGEWADKSQKAMIENIKLNGGRTTKEHMDMYLCDTDVLAEYCCWDTILARMMFDLLDPRLKEEGLYDLFYIQEILPLYKEVTIDMKRNGFPIDVAHFENLKREISLDIVRLEKEIIEDVSEDIKPFVDSLLERDYPLSRKGNFAKYAAKYYNTPLPLGKTGAETLGKASIEKASASDPNNIFFRWMLGDLELTSEVIRAIQISWLKGDKDREHVFNLNSNDHLGWLLFTKYGEVPESRTETGKPQIDDDYLNSIKGDYPFVNKLLDYKKLNKLLSTYVLGILDRHIDGVIYTSMLQWGTTSGRYSSADPNLQNQIRIKDEESDISPLVLKYANAIKRGFVAGPGYKLVNADYESLEPVCFAHASGDEKLREVFRKGYDLYSQIAIDVFGVVGCSADKKSPNYLKKKHPELRQKAKVFCLAVVYGAESGRISQAMNIDYHEATQIIEAYLEAYPGLKSYMMKCDHMAKKYGMVKTEFGRIRHLPHAKEIYSKWGDKLLNKKWAKAHGYDEVRYKLKNALNNSKNFPIQGIAAHIVNRAMIATNRAFKANNIDARIVLQCHDELTCRATQDHAEMASKILQRCMEETTKISVPLRAVPLVASNWAEAK